MLKYDHEESYFKRFDVDLTEIRKTADGVHCRVKLTAPQTGSTTPTTNGAMTQYIEFGVWLPIRPAASDWEIKKEALETARSILDFEIEKHLTALSEAWKRPPTQEGY